MKLKCRTVLVKCKSVLLYVLLSLTTFGVTVSLIKYGVLSANAEVCTTNYDGMSLG